MLRNMGVAVVLAAVLGVGGTDARADVQVVPGVLESAAGNSQSNSLLREFNNPRAVQMIIAREQLANVPTGSMLTALTVRLKADGTGAWPATPLSFASYSVTIGSAALGPGAFSTTFANNQLPDVQTVRAGALSLGAGSLLGGAATGGVNAMSLLVTFDQPVRYDGQDLVLTFRHTGSSGANGVTRFLDAVSSASSSYGVGGVASISAVSATATTGAGAPAPVVGLVYTPGSVPATMVTPVTRAGMPGTTQVTELLGSAGRTYMMVIDESQLGWMAPGCVIEGMRLRAAAGSAPWPTDARTFTTLEVALGKAAKKSSEMSVTFTDNTATGTGVVCAAGARTFVVGALRSETAGEPAAAGLAVKFTTPFVYQGGGLVVQIRHNSSGTPVFSGPALDAVADGTPLMAARIATGDTAFTATAGVPAPVLIAEWDVSPAVVLPSAQLAASGDTTTVEVLSSGPTVTQLVVNPQALANVPIGSEIEGLSLRGASTASPTASTYTSSLEIAMSHARTDASTFSARITENAGSDRVVVRRGGLAISAGAFSVTDPLARRWGPVIRFDTPFVYRGGPLHITINSAGFGAAAGTMRLEAIGATVQATSAVRGGTSSSVDLLNTTAGSAAPVVRLHVRQGLTRPVWAGGSVGGSVEGGLLSPRERTVQWVVSMSDLPVGARRMTIGGLAFRLARGATSGPRNEATFDRFDVTIATAASGGRVTETLADNTQGSASRVRSGPLVVPAMSLRTVEENPADVAAPATWVVRFDRPYVWEEGDICITVRTSGWSAVETLALDAAAGGGAGGVVGVVADGASATTGTFATVPVITLLHGRTIWKSPADIADSMGNAPPTGYNAGVDGGDFSAFFEGYFNNAPWCDIADGVGNPEPSEEYNPGVDGGDFNAFVTYYFL